MMAIEDATRVCDPKNFNSEFEEVIEQLEEELIIDEDEAEGYRECLYGYLNDYIRFASSERPSDRLVDRLHKRTVDMIYGAIGARDMQKNDVEFQMEVASNYLLDCGVEFDDDGNIIHIPDELNTQCERWLEDYEVLQKTIDILEEHKKLLEEIKKKCWMADNRLEKVTCIEEFVQATHTRGPFLSTGCGLPLPEPVIYEEPPLGIDTLGDVANNMVKNVLTCLRDFRGT